VPGKLDDYIANPRDNLYRSLHTTVVHTSGQHIKLRIRTEAMDKVSVVGVLAKWLYAGTPLWSKGIAERMDAFFESIRAQIHVDSQNLSESVRAVVEDVFGTQIQVYTPQGDMRNLVTGATAVDFAYAIHTGLGNQCQAAYVNNELYPLNKPLQNGDRVRIEKREWTQPHRAWLDEDLGYIVTNYARNHIRRWFRRLPDDLAIHQGKELLEDESQVLQLSDYGHQKIAAAFGYTNPEQLYYALGKAELLPTVVATRVLEDTWASGPALDLDNVVYDAAGEQYIVTNADGRRLQLCRTCTPQPGDVIVGFLRRDNAVTVHKESCHSIRPERSTGRLLKLGWGETNTRQARLMTLEVKVYDRPGLLFEIAQLLHREKINISYIHTPSRNRRGETRIILSTEIVRPRHLVRILHQIQALANVYEVQILRGGPPPVKEDYLPPSLYRPE
jgi:GTP pyrophosphokinase